MKLDGGGGGGGQCLNILYQVYVFFGPIIIRICIKSNVSYSDARLWTFGLLILLISTFLRGTSDFFNDFILTVFNFFTVTIAEECFNNLNDNYYQNVYDNAQYCAFGCCQNQQGFKFCCSYVGPVIGIVGGVIVLVVLVVVFICCFRYKRKKDKTIVLREAYEFQKQRNLQKQRAQSHSQHSSKFVRPKGVDPGS